MGKSQIVYVKINILNNKILLQLSEILQRNAYFITIILLQMIEYYRIPTKKKQIPKGQILTITEQYQLKDAIYNKSIQTIKVLNMRNSNINDDTVGVMWTINFPLQIISINIAENFSFITDLAIDHLTQCSNLIFLKHLNLADNCITDEGLGKLAKSTIMSKLQELILYGNSDISSEGLILLSESIYIKGLKKLDLHDTSVCDKGVGFYLKSQNCSALQSLDLSMNSKQITDGVLKAIYSSKYCNALRELKLQDCLITDDGLNALCLSQNGKNLQGLYLNNSIKKKNNLITDRSLEYIAHSEYVKSLKVLELRNTDVTSKGVNSLASSLGSQNLEILRFSYCQGIRDDAKKYLQSIIEYRTLQKLYLNSTMMTKEIAESIGVKYSNLNVIY